MLAAFQIGFEVFGGFLCADIFGDGDVVFLEDFFAFSVCSGVWVLEWVAGSGDFCVSDGLAAGGCIVGIGVRAGF